MKNWKTLISDANKAYKNKHFSDAIKLNEYALLIAQSDFEKTFSSSDPEKAIAAVLVSYFNIINNHIAENRFHHAHNLFEDIVVFLSNANSRVNNSAKQHQSIVNGVKKLYIEWSSFLKDHGKKLPTIGNTWIETLPTLISTLSDESSHIHSTPLSIGA